MQAKYWNRLPFPVAPVSEQRAFKGLLDVCIYPTFLRPNSRPTYFRSNMALLAICPLPVNKYSQFRLISLRLIEHSRIVTDFLGTGRLHSK